MFVTSFGRQVRDFFVALTIMLLLGAGADYGQTQTTTFSYQGKLTDGGNPAIGNYDLQFAFFDSGAGGTQIGSTLTRSGVSVSGGIFTVQLDFGVSAFPAPTVSWKLASGRQAVEPSLFIEIQGGYASTSRRSLYER